MVREFYSDDATFEAGFQGFMNWFNDEGVSLVGQKATTDNTDAFSLGNLLKEDVASLPLDEDRNLFEVEGEGLRLYGAIFEGSVVTLGPSDCFQFGHYHELFHSNWNALKYQYDRVFGHLYYDKWWQASSTGGHKMNIHLA